MPELNESETNGLVANERFAARRWACCCHWCSAELTSIEGLTPCSLRSSA